MADRIPVALEEKFRKRLTFYQDIGIDLFYRDRFSQQRASVTEEINLPTPIPKPQPVKLTGTTPLPAPKLNMLPRSSDVSLFDSMNKIADDSLPKILADIGDCTRCKLHRGRTKLVFGDGNPQAELVFVGEGPGRDEDAQGLPFVGRAGKLLTQMIEAMGLLRKDVYICNVVKCRPPENRTPEKDEVQTCSPFLLRQLDAIAPKVIVCLGSVAAQTLLETNRGISHFRGEWLDFRGRKLMATYHPAYLLRNPSAKGEVWKDLQKVMAVLGLQGKKGLPAGAGQSSGKPS
ncbi:MAG TPA: uracil-DNA glycosylase [Candidatus Acidoferrum sp.]